MKTYQEIVFTRTPLKKCFRYKDKFRLLPFNNSSIKNNLFVVDYPCVLEYQFATTDPISIETQLNTEIELCLLLTAFSTYRFFTYDIHASAWGISIPAFGLDFYKEKNLQEEFSKQSCNYYYPHFYYPGIQNDLNTISTSPTDNMVLKKDYYSYFSPDNDLYYLKKDNDELELAQCTVNCLDKYYSLNSKNKQKILSIARLISDSISIATYRKSLSFLSGIAAIESLASYNTPKAIDVIESCSYCHHISESPYKCPKCGRPIWGVTQKAKLFFAKYISNQENDLKLFNDMYNQRSKITHLGDVFLSDLMFDFTKTDTDIQSKMCYEVIRFARMGLNNTLLNKTNN